jgi:hypothetical protein
VRNLFLNVGEMMMLRVLRLENNASLKQAKSRIRAERDENERTLSFLQNAFLFLPQSLLSVVLSEFWGLQAQFRLHSLQFDVLCITCLTLIHDEGSQED